MELKSALRHLKVISGIGCSFHDATKSSIPKAATYFNGKTGHTKFIPVIIQREVSALHHVDEFESYDSFFFVFFCFFYFIIIYAKCKGYIIAY